MCIDDVSAHVSVRGVTPQRACVCVAGVTSLHTCVSVAGVTSLCAWCDVTVRVSVRGVTSLHTCVSVSGVTSLCACVCVSGVTSLPERGVVAVEGRGEGPAGREHARAAVVVAVRVDGGHVLHLAAALRLLLPELEHTRSSY